MSVKDATSTFLLFIIAKASKIAKAQTTSGAKQQGWWGRFVGVEMVFGRIVKDSLQGLFAYSQPLVHIIMKVFQSTWFSG